MNVPCENGEPGCFGYEIYEDGKLIGTGGPYCSQGSAADAAKEKIKEIEFKRPKNPVQPTGPKL